MKILVTGGLGYIGSHVVVDLIKQGHTVYSIDDASRSIHGAFHDIKEQTGVIVKNYLQDLANYDMFNSSVDLNELDNCDCVIHCAGYKSVGESMEKPYLYYKNNIDSTFNLLKIMKKCNIKNLIFSSSCTVYGSQHNIVTENSPIGNCASPYGWSKYMQEQMFKDICKADPEMSICSLRYFNPIGSYNYLSDRSKTNLVPALLDVVNGKREKLLVFGHDYITKDGTCIRDYVHVEDLARAHVSILDFVKNTKGYNVFNIGSGIGYSVLDIIYTFEEVNGIKVPYEFAPRREGDVAIAYADNKKIRDTINWKPKYTFNDMLDLRN